MPEVLPPPHDKHITTITSYFESVPLYSLNDYSFRDKIAHTAVALQRIESIASIDDNIDEGRIRAILEIPEDLFELTQENRLSKKQIIDLVFGFASNTGKLIGFIAADVTRTHSKDEKTNLLRQAYLAVLFLRQRYNLPENWPRYSPESGFRYEVARKLESMIDGSVYQACNLSADNLDETIERAQFLATAGEWGFLSKEKFRLLTEAWATTAFTSLIGNTTSEPLHKPEN